MSEPIRDAILDTVLALQLTVAWAGEGLSEPPRLGWWQTDLVDELGGGDLLARLLPPIAGRPSKRCSGPRPAPTPGRGRSWPGRRR